MQSSERYLEAAEAAEAGQCDRKVARIRRALEGTGEDECVDCGDPIDVARRMALPSARRCVACQSARERR